MKTLETYTSKKAALEAAKAFRAAGKTVKVFKSERIATVPKKGIEVTVSYFVAEVEA